MPKGRKKLEFCRYIVCTLSRILLLNSFLGLFVFCLNFLVPPSPPQLEVELSPIADGGNLTLSAGKEATVRCLSRGGNPAANVKWFLDDRELVGQYNQTNTTDIGKVKTWMAVSTLTYTFNKTDHSKLLRCVALHEAYPTKSRESSVTLDIHCKFFYLPLFDLI